MVEDLVGLQGPRVQARAAAGAADPARPARSRASGPRRRAGRRARPAPAGPRRRPPRRPRRGRPRAGRRSGIAASTAPATAATPTSTRNTTANPASAPAARRPAPGQQEGAEAERDRRRVGAGDAREGHRARDGQPRAQRKRLGRLAAGEEVGEHGDGRVEHHAHHPPAQQRRAEEQVEPAGEEVLPGPVVGVEVAVGQLALGDPRAGLQDEALVVGVDAPPDRHARQHGAQHEEDGGRQRARPGAPHVARGPPAGRASTTSWNWRVSASGRPLHVPRRIGPESSSPWASSRARSQASS